jgi:CRISPR-associated protein Csd1
MLKELYDYAMRNELTIPSGFINKTVKAYILLYADGTFHDIEIGGDEAIPVPDIGSLANGKDKSNVLLEKRSVVIPKDATAKSRFFLNALKDAAKYEPMLASCVKAIETKDTADLIRQRLDERKIKDNDRISFKVDQRSILKSASIQEWWQIFRQQFQKAISDNRTICLITGNPTIPMKTTYPITGLLQVGGHSSGDSLICFDKTAYCSYDLKKAANAPVSEEAFSAVKTALDDLLSKAPILAGMKFVHWYDRDVPVQDDPIVQSSDFGFSGFVMEDDDEEDENESDEGTDVLAEAERKAIKLADSLVKSVKTGEQVFIPEKTNYYILLLTGVSGRIMIRRYERGSYQELKRALACWHEDLSLIGPSADRNISSCKLTARMLKLLNFQNADNKPFERMEKELSGLSSSILMSILTGSPLPEAVAARALAFIRSSMMSADDDTADNLFKKDVCVWQWLKVWLLRNKGKRGLLMREYNQDYPSSAYHCGAMMAVYEAIQKVAMPNVNVTVLQRYYSSAIQTPALVIGRLSQMSVHHLEMIENRWLAEHMRERLAQISTAIHGSIPVVLDLENQSEFALGYYQMRAEMIRERKEKIASKNERDSVNENKEDI